MVGAAGCLYVGGINHAPEVSVTLQESSELRKDGEAVLVAGGSDEDGDSLQHTWWVRGTDLDGASFGLDRERRPAEVASPIPSDGRLTLTLVRRGRYEVEVEARDPLGATSRATTRFEVANEPPRFELDLQPLDPTITGHPAHARYVISVRDQPGGDDVLSCEAGAEVTWTLRSPDEAALARWEVLPCAGATLDRLLVAGQATDEAVTLEVEARVTDGGGAEATVVKGWTLEANRPPCISGTDPDFRAATKVLVLHDPDPEPGQVGRTFDATHVVDDVAEHRYRWSASPTADGPFAPLPTQPGRTLSLAPDQESPGESFYLRLTVDDGHGAPIACAEAEPRCEAEPGSGCYRWVTWQVEYR